MTTYTREPMIRPSTSRGSRSNSLTDGPRWYRARIRILGPPGALVVPAIVGTIAYLSLQLFDTAWSGAVGLIGGVFAAPGLLVAGAPFGNRDLYPMAILGSGVLWFLVGVVAAHRATRNPMATWVDYWRHYAWLCAGIWLGAVLALVMAALVISDSLY